MTSKSNYATVKKVPTYIHCLQYAPIRYNAKRAEIFVYFEETNYYTFEIDRQGKGCCLSFLVNGELKRVKHFEKDFREVADDCFQGWLTGTKIDTIDIRGDYNGKIPPTLEISNFSFTDKYNRPSTSIPAWLDSLQDNPINFLLMSDHWEKILSLKNFSNPNSTCKLTGYDGIGHEHVEKIQFKQIELNNVKDEKPFNVLVKKWISGSFPDTFEWLIVTSVTRPLKSERLLEDINVEALDGEIFKESDKEIQERDAVEYYLIFGQNNRYGVFCGIDNFARFSVITKEFVDINPRLEAYYRSEDMKKLEEE